MTLYETTRQTTIDGHVNGLDICTEFGICLQGWPRDDRARKTLCSIKTEKRIGLSQGAAWLAQYSSLWHLAGCLSFARQSHAPLLGNEGTLIGVASCQAGPERRCRYSHCSLLHGSPTLPPSIGLPSFWSEYAPRWQ